MTAQAYNWNVIVRGSWNRAIFTPAWIAKELFSLGDGTPIEIQVAVDIIGPIRVRHDQLVVSVGKGVLEVITEDHSFTGLQKALGVGALALEKLPVTPVTAAGFNVRYKFGDVTPNIVELFDSSLDMKLCKQNSILSRSFSRKIKPNEKCLREGIIELNATLHSEDNRLP